MFNTQTFRQSFLLFSFFLFVTLLSAQDGTVRGKIYDDSGMEASFATVLVNELDGVGTTADLEGSFALTLPAGDYSLKISYVGFGDVTISDVNVKAGDVTVINNIALKNESEELVEVVVTARASRNTAGSVLSIQKKAASFLSGVSVQSISQTGDSDAGAAVKRITGVTVEDGKNVYVRGLGDRYTKTVLNGMEVPGLDPDRNTVQVDVFPSNILNNILVYKTFTPDLSGDFTGGTVDIELKNFPDERNVSYSASLAYNSMTTFNDNFLTYNASPLDVLGFGAGSRQSPIAPDYRIPQAIPGVTGQESIVKSFDREMAVSEGFALPSGSLSYSFSDQFNREKRTLGITTAFNYKNSFRHYDNAIYDSYFKDVDKAEYELSPTELSTGSISSNEVLWSGLVSGSLKTKKTRHSLRLFHTQNGVKQASEAYARNFFSSEGAILDKDVLYYNQKSISSVMYDSEFSFPEKNLVIDAKISPSISFNKEPDLRFTAFAVEEDAAGRIVDINLNVGDGARISRIYRGLWETSANAKTNATWKFSQWGGREAKLKAGLSYAFKYRDFSVYRYDFRLSGNNILLNGDPNQLWEEQNLYSDATNEGLFVTGQSSPSNTYQASSGVAAAYIMNELPLTRNLKTIYGARIEKTDMRYTGQRQTVNNPETDIFDNAKVLDELNVLPSVSFVYNIVENMNLRTAYSSTVARPSFKEKSVAQIFDPITERTFIGNLDLQQTFIQNLDLRWEYFFKPGETVSLSSFYKNFQDPIEIVAYSAIAPDNFTPRNVGNAQVYGVEFETRKKLDFISPALNGFTFASNVSYVKSLVKMNDAELEGRLQEAREGEEISDTRQMQGQSPYIINATLNYSSPDNDWNANVSYNVQGKRLSVVGISRIPDVFEQPFHGLNVKTSKFIGRNNNWQMSLSANNLLNQKRQRVYESFGAENEYLFESLQPGVTVSFGVSYNMTGSKESATKFAKK